jgi:hypothetical protein
MKYAADLGMAPATGKRGQNQIGEVFFGDEILDSFINL